MNVHAQGQPAEVKMTIHVTRKDTGLMETYDLVGRTTLPPAEEPQHPRQLNLFEPPKEPV
jgi:hypothetical protein